MKLEGKRAIVTGAASGIGRATAEAFLAEGARVSLLDRDKAGLLDLAQSFDQGVARPFVAELTRKSEVDAAIDDSLGFLEGLDVVVNAAGAGIPGALHEMDEETWDRQMDLNVKTTYLVTHAAWPHLVASGGGVVLNTGSICSFWGFQGLAAYCATKGAVLMLTKCLALDGAEAGIRANVVCPGDTQTPNIVKYYDSFDDPAGARRRAERAYPLDRFARPSEIAAGFVFLAGDAAAFITGSHLMIDGGRTSGAWYPQPIA